ncbi:peroxisomal carnitine O-octanoyltransferase-like isoform X2 [Ptychodera flava]
MMSKQISERTFQNEDSLPSMPVPPLQQTLKKYLDSVKPHTNTDEFKKTVQIVKSFEEGIGKELHEKLVEKSKQERNWLEMWWDKYAYHSSRFSTAVNTNLSGYLPMVEDVWPMRDGTQTERSALCLWNIIHFWDTLKKEKLPVDVERIGNKNLSMYQYSRLFNTCRIPGVPFDWLDCHFKTESQRGCPSNIVILRNGRYFSFSALDDKGEILTAPELQRQIEYIKAKCDSEPSLPSVGALTALERTQWAKIRDHMIKIDPKNEDSLRTIESCIIVMSLENSKPTTFTELHYEGMAGDPYNRWFDKPIQFISHKNGAFTFNGDHSAADGIAIMTFIWNVYSSILQSNGKWQGSQEDRQLSLPEEVKFTTDEKILQCIDGGAELYKKESSNIDLTHGELNFDRNLLKARKLHPDAMVQLVLQLTYYKIHQKPAPTYETATTRQFYRGRTETVRSCTVEAIDWSKAMLDPEVSTEKRLELLGRAVIKQNSLMNEGKQNHGCDRHLFGLQILAMESGLPTPEIFDDESFVKSGGGGNFILSTSLVGYTIMHGCVAPMCPNGYGVFYSMPKKSLRIMILTWKNNAETDSQVFFQTFDRTLQETMVLISKAKL